VHLEEKLKSILKRNQYEGNSRSGAKKGCVVTAPEKERPKCAVIRKRVESLKSLLEEII